MAKVSIAVFLCYLYSMYVFLMGFLLLYFSYVINKVQREFSNRLYFGHKFEIIRTIFTKTSESYIQTTVTQQQNYFLNKTTYYFSLLVRNAFWDTLPSKVYRSILDKMGVTRAHLGTSTILALMQTHKYYTNIEKKPGTLFLSMQECLHRFWKHDSGGTIKLVQSKFTVKRVQ